MKRILIIFSIVSSISVNGQLNVYSGIAHQMMTSDFLGAEYQISNVQYTGSLFAIGSFEASGTTIGFQSGIVLTTGEVIADNKGPVGPNDSGSSGVDNNQPGSPILSAINGGNATFNAATLEFDFVSSVDTFRLKYIFGSEEYPEFAPPNNSSYSDVFGLFITGPGISGMQNIAKLPSGMIVSINTVNTITNSSYYVSNGNGSQSPYMDEDQYIQYDGFTTVLEAKNAVQIGETYHMIIAISDVGDGIYDSGIFLERCDSCSFYAENETLSPIQDVSIYPNPARDELIIENNSGEIIKVEIVDLMGNFIETQDLPFSLSTIDTSKYPDGMYFIRISNDDFVTMMPIVIQQ